MCVPSTRFCFVPMGSVADPLGVVFAVLCMSALSAKRALRTGLVDALLDIEDRFPHEHRY